MNLETVEERCDVFGLASAGEVLVNLEFRGESLSSLEL